MHVYIFYFHYFCSVKEFYRQLLAVLAAHYEAREAQAIAFLVCEEAFGWRKRTFMRTKLANYPRQNKKEPPLCFVAWAQESRCSMF